MNRDENQLLIDPASGAKAGAQNLLVNCVDVKPGERVLLVAEEPEKNFYCATLSNILSEQVLALGAQPTYIEAGLIVDPVDFPTDVIQAMAKVDHTIFLNRIGDYSRFLSLPGGCSKTICYALDAEALSSPFATISHRLMCELLEKLETELEQSESWRITCQLGTDIGGTFCWPSSSGGKDDEFSMSTFPVTTFKPVPCTTANGKVAISRWLVPGAAAKVQPGTVELDDVVMMEVCDGIIVNMDGPSSSSEAAAKHYDFISSALSINRNRVHSWHAGINPHTFYNGVIENNLERWGAVSFASPRYLHFHTCGDTPPGEITWSVFNPTVFVDGEIFWENGEFVWLKKQIDDDLRLQYSDAESLLVESANIGV